MVREIVTAMVLCAGIIAGNADAGGILPEEAVDYTENAAEAAEDESVIPEYIVTQQRFSSFSNLLPGESQTQVFSVLNMDEVMHTYYLRVESSACMTMEMTKGGDFFAQGAVADDAMELVTLTPGENKVFSLTLAEPEDGDGCTKVKLHFTKR